jgi:hypothetical protein
MFNMIGLVVIATNSHEKHMKQPLNFALKVPTFSIVEGNSK